MSLRVLQRAGRELIVRRHSEFYGTISVGTPAVDYNVILDTGSSDLILATSPCTGCETTTTLYTPSDSSTVTTSTTTFAITYVSPSRARPLARHTRAPF